MSGSLVRWTLTGLALLGAGYGALAAGATKTPGGTLDRSFGKSGVVTTSFARQRQYFFAVGVQPDGKIVAAGAGGKSGLILGRYKKRGALDSTFGRGGKVTNSAFDARALVLQPDGKIITAGSAADGFALARFHSDGSPDASFGNLGVAVTRIGSWSLANAVALQRDGKIVAAGVADPNVFAIARYNANGSLDRSFGSGGTATTKFGDPPWLQAADSVSVQSDGKIVVAGAAGHLDDFNGPIVFALARFNPDGSLDRSFGSGGKVTTAFGSDWAEAKAVALQPDGKILVGGSYLYDLPGSGQTEKIALARYKPDGSLDPAFGSGGKLTRFFVADGPYVASEAYGLALQRDGRILLAGGAQRPPLGRFVFTVARYFPNGAPDPRFGVVTSFPGGSEAYAVALQHNGRIVAAGVADFDSSTSRAALARYLPNRPHCRVPKLKGRTLAQARRTLYRSYCTLGRVTRVHTPRFDTGKILRQRPRAHSVRPAGAKVRVWVSAHRRRSRR